MGRSCGGKVILFLSLLGISCFAEGGCPLADKYRQKGSVNQENTALFLCATQYNDDESQIKLAEYYLKGENGLSKSETDALYMYQLSAENGNAEAQVKLAELLQSFDISAERRRELKNYQARLQKTNDEPNSFSGEILHPYTLLLLASERPENKWYYPSLIRTAPSRASKLLSQYKLSSERRQIAMQDASRWKTRKLLEAAKEVMSSVEYPEFEKRLKNNATRSEAMADLKKYLTSYVENRQKERSKSL